MKDAIIYATYVGLYLVLILAFNLGAIYIIITYGFSLISYIFT